MKEDSEFYNIIMQRKEKVSSKKFEKFFRTMYYDNMLNMISSTSITMENLFNAFILVENVKFELLDYSFNQNNHIFKIKSLYTGNSLLFKFKYNYSIT